MLIVRLLIGLDFKLITQDLVLAYVYVDFIEIEIRL